MSNTPEREPGPDIDVHGDTALSPGFAHTATEPGSPRARETVARRLAHFAIESELGRGGMGVVYRAQDLSLERPVAIKVLANQVALSPDRRRRFYREARAQARLNHPNVGHIYYIGESDDEMFFAMELIDGTSVSELLAERGALPVAEAIDICRQAVRGLAEAERHGVVHRDVKPSNLMIDRHNVVKVLDFGIAAEIDVRGPGAGDEGRAEQTSLAGTPLYAAPEQGRGEAVDFRADIYALGVTLHQLISGEPPFRGDSPEELITKHESETRPRLSRKQVRREPTPVDALIDRMMAKEPGDRFASYAELLEAMDMVEPEVGRRAQLFPRFASTLIDGLFWAVPMILLQELAGVSISGLTWSLVWFAYQIIAQARGGATPGQRLMGLRVVAEGRAAGVGLRRAMVRTLLLWGPWVIIDGGEQIANLLNVNVVGRIFDIAGLGYLLLIAVAASVAVVRSGGRAWWDRWAGTEVRTTR